MDSLEEDVGKRFSSLEEKADLRMENVGKRFSSLEEKVDRILAVLDDQ